MLKDIYQISTAATIVWNYIGTIITMLLLHRFVDTTCGTGLNPKITRLH